jgi:hypothetical protein
LWRPCSATWSWRNDTSGHTLHDVLELLALLSESLLSGARSKFTTPLMPVLMWIASRSSLLHLSTCRTARSQATRAQLKRHGCEYHCYTLERDQHPLVVYMRRNHFSKHEYIGYSACGMTNREMSRSRKYRQRSLVSKEPALIWWETHQEDRLNFYNWANIVIKTTDSKIQAKI